MLDEAAADAYLHNIACCQSSGGGQVVIGRKPRPRYLLRLLRPPLPVPLAGQVVPPPPPAL